MARTRVERLRDLVQVIERLPVSPERDRLLSEVRARAVDVDTGVTPRAMLPLREPAPAPARPRSPTRETVASIIPALRPLPPGAVAFSRPAFAAAAPRTWTSRSRVDERVPLGDSPGSSPLT